VCRRGQVWHGVCVVRPRWHVCAVACVGVVCGRCVGRWQVAVLGVGVVVCSVVGRGVCVVCVAWCVCVVGGCVCVGEVGNGGGCVVGPRECARAVW